MFVAEKWWVFVLVGVVLLGYTLISQAGRIKYLSEGDPFSKGPGDFLRGMVLSAILGLVGGLSLLLGLVGLVASLVRG